MKIETKYNIGDNIWFMNANKAVCYKINSFKISIYRKGTNANNVNQEYTIEYSPEGLVLFLNEDNCFATKEELLNSL